MESLCKPCGISFSAIEGHNCQFVYVPAQTNESNHDLQLIDMSGKMMELSDGTLVPYKDWFNAYNNPTAVVFHDGWIDNMKKE